MTFEVDERQRALCDSIVRLAREELNEGLDERARAGAFSWVGWRRCAELRIAGLPFDERFGGCGADLYTTAASLQALAYACRDAGLVHALTTQILCGLQLARFGDDDQRERYLPALCRGESVFAQAITEPGSGSDALAMRTRAVPDGDHYRLDGTKQFITNAPIADVALVFAVTDPDAPPLARVSCFAVGTEFAGVQRGAPLAKMGLSTLQNGELVFDGCVVPADALVGREGQGALAFGEAMDDERILLAAAHLGTLQRVLETCVRYAREREAFGAAIGSYQAISHKIAEMKVGLQLGTLAVSDAARRKDRGARVPVEASITKLFVSERLKQACLDAVQIHGGYGYMEEFGVERDLRDAIASTIYSGTSELQRNIIARWLGL